VTMERSLRATGIANAATLSVSHTMAAPFCPRVWCKLQIARRNTYFINARNIVTARRTSLSLSLSLSLSRLPVSISWTAMSERDGKREKGREGQRERDSERETARERERERERQRERQREIFIPPRLWKRSHR